MTTEISALLIPDPARRDRPPGSLSFFFLLPTMNPYGGVVSIVNLANALLDLGHRVVIGCLSRHREDLVFPRTEPIYVEDPAALSSMLGPGFDVVVATSWQTVGPVSALAEATDSLPLYFVQDFEPDFYEDQDRKTEARATYDLIPHRVVKTTYLQERLMAEGSWHAHLIPPGMNLDIFYPRQALAARPPKSVLAMARPGTPADHRGFGVLRDVFAELHRRDPLIDLAVFGTAKEELFDCPVRALGRLDPTRLPAVYSSVKVFVDTSLKHGFGRTGVEAMACGTPCVLSDSGGISEYATHGQNAIIVPVGDVDATVAAIELLLADHDLADRLARTGMATVAAFAEPTAAESFVRLTCSLTS